MKQKLLLKSLLLLCAFLVGGASSAWAEDPALTLDFTSAWTAGDDNSAGEKVFTKTVGTTTYTISGTGGANFKFNSGYFIFGKTNAYIKLPTVDFNVEKIEVVGNSGASGSVVHNIFVGNTAVSTAVTGLNGTTSSFEIGESYQTAGTQYVLKITSNHNAQITYVKYYKKTSGGDPTPTCAAPTFSPAEGVYPLYQTVTISTTTEGASIMYTTDGTDPLTYGTKYYSPISVRSKTTIKAITLKEGYNYSTVASATYSFAGTKHAGTESDPLNIADAQTYITALGSSTSPIDVCVIGKISQIDSYNNTYKSITYWISDDGTTTNQMEVYSGKGLDGADFSAVTDLTVGDVVTVKGKVKKFNTTYEFDKNNQLVSRFPVGSTVDITIPESKLTTFCNANAIDFTGSGVTAYTAKSDGSVVTLTPIAAGIVPAKAGVILRADAAGTYEGAITTGGSITNENEMVGVLVDTPVYFNPTATTGIGCFILQNGAFYKAGEMSAAKLKAGKAYLKTHTNIGQTHGNNAPLAIVFEGETTGITNTNCTNDTNIGVVYDLSGRRVAQPTKGLYIVNGRKMIIK